MHVACMVLATLPLAISIFVVEDERYGGLLVGLTMASKTASNVGSIWKDLDDQRTRGLFCDVL